MTLIEVMISMIVLGIVLVGLGQALTYGIRVNNESKVRMTNLNMCKYMMETLKTRISQPDTFDVTDPSNTNYYVDADGELTYSGSGGTKTPAFTSSSAFRVNVAISNSTLTKTEAGVTKVLLKTLEVKVVDIQNASKPGREISMKVEIMRPTA
jgi:Tfp pilus assembly protein PilV